MTGFHKFVLRVAHAVLIDGAGVEIPAVIVDVGDIFESLAPDVGRDPVRVGLQGPQGDDQLVAVMGDGVVGDEHAQCW